MISLPGNPKEIRDQISPSIDSLLLVLYKPLYVLLDRFIYLRRDKDGVDPNEVILELLRHVLDDKRTSLFHLEVHTK